MKHCQRSTIFLNSRILLSFLICLVTAAAAAADTLVIVLGPNDEYTIYHNSPDYYLVAIEYGTLILEGSGPGVHPPDFSHYDNFDHIVGLTWTKGTLRYSGCYLGPSEQTPDDPAFYQLPLIAGSGLRLSFEDCYLEGGSRAVVLDSGWVDIYNSVLTGHDLGLYCKYTRDTVNLTDTWISRCDTGIRMDAGSLKARSCAIVSNRQALFAGGSSSFNLRETLLQSNHSMVTFIDTVSLELKACDFTQVGGYCLEARSEWEYMQQLTVDSCWFDPETIGDEQKLFNFPPDSVTNELPDALRDASVPVAPVVIHVDDNEPMLEVVIVGRDTSDLPVQPRALKMYHFGGEGFDPWLPDSVFTDQEFQDSSHAATYAVPPFEGEETLVDSILVSELIPGSPGGDAHPGIIWGRVTLDFEEEDLPE